MSERSERCLPFVGGLAGPAAWAVAHFGFDFAPTGANVRSVLEGMIGFGGVVVGFLLTAKSLLFALPEGRTTKFMRDSGYFVVLIDYLMTDICVWLIVTAASVVILLTTPADDVAAGHALSVTLIAWSYGISVGGLTLLRSARLVSRFLRAAWSDQTKEWTKP